MAETTALEKVLRSRENDYQEALGALREFAEEYNDQLEACAVLREAVFVVHCLRGLIAQRSCKEIHDAFGAPGDFGYHTAIGQALSDFYRDQWGK